MQSINFILVVITAFSFEICAIKGAGYNLLWFAPIGFVVAWYVAKGSREILWHWDFDVKNPEGKRRK